MKLVLEGKLGEFDLAQVLEVVGLGRQYTGVEVLRSDGRAGTIYVKSGVVVRVHAPPDEGKRAFFRLFGGDPGRFHVFRMDTPAALPEPVGPLRELLAEAASGAAEAANPHGSVAPPPRPVSNVRPAPAAGPSVRPAPPAPRLSSTPPRRAGESERGRVIAIVSPKGGCGKTTIALNTAIALARQGHPVVLVDADVNGDVLSCINARDRAEFGTFDVLAGRAEASRGLLPTVVANLQILPAVGARLPDAEVLGGDLRARLRQLLRALSRDAHVLVDTPAGMFGLTRQVLSESTHVLAVLQAEIVAQRSFERFREALAGIPATERPHVLGVVLNMLQMRHGGSLSVLQNVCIDLPADWLFETSIPRHNAIVDATAQGVPVRHLDERSPPAVAFLFDTLASEIAQRLRVSPLEYRPTPFLV